MKITKWLLIALVLFAIPACTVNTCQFGIASDGDLSQVQQGDAPGTDWEMVTIVAVLSLLAICFLLLMALASRTGMGPG